MVFKEITINNVFSYNGEISFAFEKGDNPVTLIVGENGFGKTSFINSLKIALHGINKDVLNIGGQFLSKEDFILGSSKKNFSGVLNRTAKRNGENTASIKVTVESGAETITITRTFLIKDKDYSEELVLFDESGKILAEGDDAQDIVNQMISPTMARFFFFDGEKIQTISDFSHEEFTQMLEDVLELDIYDKMISDSQHLIKKINKESMSDELKADVEKKETELSLVAKDIESSKEDKKVKLGELKIIQKEKTTLEASILKTKSKHHKPLLEARELYQILLEEKAELTEEMKISTLGELPLLLNSDLAAKVEKDISENYAERLQIDPSILRKKRERMSELLSAFMDKEKASEVFGEVFNQDDSFSVPFADAKHVSNQFGSFKGEYLPMLLSNLSSIAHEIQKSISEITSIEQKIDEENAGLSDARVRVVKLTEDVVQQTVSIETLIAHIESLEEKEKDLKRDLARLTIQEHKNDISAAKAKTLESVIRIAEEMKKEIKKNKRSALEASINSKFRLLRKAGYEADKLSLDANFNVSLYDEAGCAMDILSSSSGQKQIIATALIWGISEFIGEDIPMVIDTPLGRLDEKNQSLILEKFYPQVSSQVIILPTPSEIKHEGFLQLSQHVSQSFVLSNGGSATTVRTTDIDNLIWNKSNTKPRQLEIGELA